jgi:hypothetical protein
VSADSVEPKGGDEGVALSAATYRGPNIADDAADPQREAVYRAEELWGYETDEWGDDPDELGWGGEGPAPIGVDELSTFAASVLSRAGWQVNTPPRFVLDVPDDVGDANEAAWHEGATRVIHLHPNLLDPGTVLHELAHWLRPCDGHGPEFCGVHLGLVRVGISERAAELLREAYRESDVEVDETWANGEE